MKLIIFDLDGTLLNTLADLAASVNFALQHFGFPAHAPQEYNFMVGNGVNNLLTRALPPEFRNNSDVHSMLRNEFLRHYATHADHLTCPYDGLAELLQTLQQQGLMLAVASNKMHDATVALVKRFFPDINFVAVIGQREGAAVKPNPAIVEEIIQKTQVSKNEVLYVGDSGVDVQTARNAEVRFVGVLWGFRPKIELEAMGAKEFVSNAAELKKFILQ